MLQRGLQQFAKPWYRLRALRVFRDDASLSANPDLWGSITNALDQSDYFILLASPAAAQSQWVAKEAEYWLEHRGTEQMLVVLTEGELFWVPGRGVDRTRTSALPEPLDDAFDEEPRYVDLRWARGDARLVPKDARFRAALADLAAPIHGRSKDEMLGEEVVQHRRTLRIAWGAAAVLAGLTIAASVLSVFAVQQRDRARTQANIALSRQLAAESTAQLEGPSAISPLLALESYRRVRTGPPARQYDARNAMLVALERSPRLLATIGASDLRTAAFSPNGTTLATGDASGRVQLWSTADGHALGPPHPVSRAGARGMAYSPDGRTVAFGDERGNVTLWDVKAQAPRGTPVAAARYITLIRFSRRGSQVLVAGAAGSYGPDEVMVWRTDELRAAPRVLKVEAGSINDARFTPDGGAVVAALDYGDLEEWTLHGPPPRHVAHGYALTTGTGGRVLVLTKVPGGMRIVDAVDGAPVGPRVPITTEFFAAAAPGGRTLAQGSTGSTTQTVALWNVRGRKIVAETLPSDQGAYATPVFDPGGTRLATVGQDGTVKLWLARDSNPLAEDFAPAGSGSPTVVALGPSGTMAAGNSSSLTIWAGGVSKTHPARSGVSSLAISPTGSLLAAGGGNGDITFWNPGLQKHIVTLENPYRSQVSSLEFDASGDRLTSRSSDGGVAVWDTSGTRPTLRSHTRTPIARPPGCPGDQSSRYREGCAEEPTSSATLPNGTLVYGTVDAGVKFWDPEQKQSRGGLGDKGLDVVLAPDGATLATRSFIPAAVRLWDVARRQPLGDELTDPAGIAVVAFKGDGTQLVSTTRSGAVTVWDPVLLSTDFGSWRARLCRIAGRNLTRAEWAQFLPGQPYRTTCPRLP